jgi:hypothetical protein
MCRGYNMGMRMVDEFFAKSKAPRCKSFRDTAETIAGVGAARPLAAACEVLARSCYLCIAPLPCFVCPALLSPCCCVCTPFDVQDAFRIFLGIPAGVDSWNADNTACTIKFGENPLTGAVVVGILHVGFQPHIQSRKGVASRLGRS